MRDILSDLIVERALADERFIVISGDHGYALFDRLRHERPDQFLNAGIMEQTVVGLAAGLAKIGFRPMVYGLASFMPVRALEQIKLDLCLANLPVVVLGDGAGLVYSNLGASHQCGEDVACLMPMPNLRIYSPSDRYELQKSFMECATNAGPSYLRIGKADRPPSHAGNLETLLPHFTHREAPANGCLVATGSMVAVAYQIAQKEKLSCISVPRLKPFAPELTELVAPFRQVMVLEEHSRYGGLAAAVMDLLFEQNHLSTTVHTLALKDHFMERCGSYQYALSEHGMSDAQLLSRIRELLAKRPE